MSVDGALFARISAGVRVAPIRAAPPEAVVRRMELAAKNADSFLGMAARGASSNGAASCSRHTRPISRRSARGRFQYQTAICELTSLGHGTTVAVDATWADEASLAEALNPQGRQALVTAPGFGMRSSRRRSTPCALSRGGRLRSRLR